MPVGNKAGCGASLIAFQKMHHGDAEYTEKTIPNLGFLSASVWGRPD
jgi:hypothetical protein